MQNKQNGLLNVAALSLSKVAGYKTENCHLSANVRSVRSNGCVLGFHGTLLIEYIRTFSK